MRRILLAAVLFCAAAPALAQDEDDTTPTPGRRFIIPGEQHLDFEKDLEVAGELVRPTGTLLFDRKRAGFKPLIQLRADFNEELLTSVDEVN